MSHASAPQDYYEVLGLQKGATTVEICKAYRELALKFHPALHHDNRNVAYHHFCRVAEAFDVLYDQEKRKIYDKSGEQVLKESVLHDSSQVGKYKFTTEPQEIFEKFFGSRNVYEHLLKVGQGSGASHPIFRAQYPQQAQKSKVDHLVVPVECLLSELFNGCTKELVYERKVLAPDGKNHQTITESKKISIPPGSSSKNPLVFPGQGHSEPGVKQTDLLFSIVEKNERNYKRDGDDLVYTATISLMDALDSKSLTVIELDGNILQLHFDEIISPQTRRRIEGKGMQRQNDAGKRGDLVVVFDIMFPEELSLAEKEKVVALLGE